MSRPSILIADLKLEQNIWELAIRIVNLWIVKERNRQQHVEAIIQDAKGDQIHIVTRNRELDLWKQIIEEH
ncbi:hypothetical protein KIW84_051777 [Lathyrus oleraceus]|uniref:Replication protein A 70 kDa DNA-binding subunit B/D first OB fold domain-containing protein n=1 Tax=Pisum sativum TaxID=3888 RepID=A0A9D4WKZ0_PEA|nr:hypothetical protein KIW84_051777 [Pisum sativum]